MNQRTPPAVLYVVAYQFLIAIMDITLATRIGGLLSLLMIGIAVSHIIAAYGLARLTEVARQRAVQLAVMDILTVVFLLLNGHGTPWGTLLRVGMPFYVLSVLNDPAIRRRFS